MISDKIDKFIANGIQFQCQGSGNCCVSHGGYGFVFLTLSDRKAMAKKLEMKTSEFTKKYCMKTDGVWRLNDNVNEDCLFLKNKRCTVYEARPTQCRTWPFWPEVLNAKTWNKEVANFCPGINKGKVWDVKEIKKELKDQIKSENQYGS